MNNLVKKIVVTSLKGGTGKSMVVFNLAGCLSDRGYKVCVIDADPQSNVTQALTNREHENGVYELLTNSCKLEDVLLQPYKDYDKLKNIFLIPSNYNLFLYEKDTNIPNQIFELKNKLQDLKDFDYIIVDTNPSLSFILTSVYAYVDYYMSVFDMSNDALKGFRFLENVIIGNIKKTVNPSLEFKGIVLNNKKNSNFNMQLVNAVTSQYKDKVFNTVIADLIANKESRALNIPVIEYAPRNQASIQFSEIASEFIKVLGGGNNG